MSHSFLQGTFYSCFIFTLWGVFKQYMLPRYDSPSAICKGHFSKTMSLPCAHIMENKIMGLPLGTLRLDDVHLQWRIDIRSFSTMECELVSQNDQIDGLLKKLHDKYSTCLLFKNKVIESKMLN